jgi:hypothetical protein
VRAFEELVDEAAAVDVSGWSFAWLDGRATEERPPWGYSRLLAARLAEVDSAWWVPDFTVDRYAAALERLDGHLRAHGAFVAHSTRTLIEATPARR